MRILSYPGTWSMAEIQTQIQFDEAGALELVGCVVAINKDNQPCNNLKYNELPESPTNIFLVKAHEARPNGATTSIFNYTLVVDSQLTAVDFYR